MLIPQELPAIDTDVFLAIVLDGDVVWGEACRAAIV